MKSLLFLIFSTLLLLDVSTLPTHSQGQLDCSTTNGIICQPALINAGCDPGYTLPDCSPDTNCCAHFQSFDALNNLVCSPVACFLIGTTPTPAPTPDPSPCGQNNGICSSTGCTADQNLDTSLACSVATDSCCIPTLNISSCPPPHYLGSCKNTCDPITETAYQPLNTCGLSHQQCCLPRLSNNAVGYFCTINGVQDSGINTALGCIPYSHVAFTNEFIIYSAALSGAIALLTILYGSFLLITGGHDPKKIQAGQELIVASLAGLAMIIFCVLLVNYLGSSLLNLGPIGFR